MKNKLHKIISLLGIFVNIETTARSRNIPIYGKLYKRSFLNIKYIQIYL